MSLLLQGRRQSPLHFSARIENIENSVQAPARAFVLTGSVSTKLYYLIEANFRRGHQCGVDELTTRVMPPFLLDRAIPEFS